MGKIFKRGLFAIAPVVLTLALLFWFFGILEGIFSVPLKAIIGPFYFKGLGILVAFLCIFFVGIVVNNLIIQKLSRMGEALLQKIPFVKTLYNALGEMMRYFGSAKETQKQGQVVLVEIAGVHLLGLVTRESFEELSADFASPDEVSVFIPMSCQIGGYTVIVPRSKLRKVSLTVEEGMRFVVTAGVLAQSRK
jgi:uncharacterized membrane protein